MNIQEYSQEAQKNKAVKDSELLWKDPLRLTRRVTTRLSTKVLGKLNVPGMTVKFKPEKKD